ncbi:MAG: transglutaminase-like domain-containing protein, partial [Gemmatimonadota bacterium]
WIDHRGAVAGVATPFGLRWVRTDFDLSETEFRRALPERGAAIRNAIPSMAQFAATSWSHDSSTEERRFLVEHRDGTPVDTALLALLGGGRQSVRGDTLTIRAVPENASGAGARDTVPDPMIQHDALAIAKARRSIVSDGSNDDPIPALPAAFHSLVHVDTAATAPEDALGTLGRRGGRPDGIARLFVALSRSAGVPARYVVGVYPHGDSLLTHAWAEVWSASANGWTAVDPVAGHAIANTGLIRLAIGGSSHPDEMLALLANARLTDLARKGKQ